MDVHVKSGMMGFAVRSERTMGHAVLTSDGIASLLGSGLGKEGYLRSIEFEKSVIIHYHWISMAMP
jgi:hypothetical protein